MENLQIIRLEAQKLVLKAEQLVKGTKPSLCTSGNAYSLVTQQVFAEIRAINTLLKDKSYFKLRSH